MSSKKEIAANIIIAAVIVIMGFALVRSISNRIAPQPKTVKIDRAARNSDWGKLMLVLNTIQENYVDSIDQAQITEEILPIILSKLDPHSVYFTPEDFETADEDLQGGFDGIGIQFNVPNDTAIVTNVIAGGPSEKAGILSGDRIMKVDDRDIAGVNMPQDTMVRLMRGKKGTKVVISVKREGENDLVPFDIIRDKIPQKSVDVAFLLNDTTGYLKLSKFSRTSYLEYLQAMLKLKGQGMKRLIFDLRDNSGGYLDQAIMLSNDFLEKGKLITYMEGLHSERNDIFADGNGFSQDIELAVLINEYSASSSEIFTGAMQDNDRATVYGVRSFGKGLVQEPITFSDGSGVRLTIARYHTPTGRCIQKPYTGNDDYAYDILERFQSGEMMSADSIKVNDSLKYVTPGGKTVYGGGGIIPDVFVPLDTLGVTDFLVKCNRQSLQIKFANKMCDQYRARIREIKDMDALERFLGTLDLKGLFLKYAAENDAVPKPGEWERSGEYILTQVRAVIGRYTPMDDDAFYPIYLKIDKTVQRALEDE
ncbi:MAG: S41 family peptidase [Bacteroidales bacterium]|nr:S41 family peptidase [Bacteroidales bacterium]